MRQEDLEKDDGKCQLYGWEKRRVGLKSRNDANVYNICM